MLRLLYAAAVLSSVLLSPAHAQSPFTPAPLGEDILQKARDWQARSQPQTADRVPRRPRDTAQAG
jgi:hypothetical protein